MLNAHRQPAVGSQCLGVLPSIFLSAVSQKASGSTRYRNSFVHPGFKPVQHSLSVSFASIHSALGKSPQYRSSTSSTAGGRYKIAALRWHYRRYELKDDVPPVWRYKTLLITPSEVVVFSPHCRPSMRGSNRTDRYRACSQTFLVVIKKQTAFTLH